MAHDGAYHRTRMHDPAWAMLSSMDIDMGIQIGGDTGDSPNVLQLEPLYSVETGFLAGTVNVLIKSGKKIYDFGRRNTRDLRSIGVDATWFPVRWTPGLQKWVDETPDQERTIDVAIISYDTPRRVAITERLRAAGLNLFVSDSCYGDEAMKVMKSAKVCLCVHRQGPGQEQAQLRIAWALACGTVPVCEEAELPSITGFFPEVPYDQIVGATMDTLERWTPDVPAKILKQFQVYSEALEGAMKKAPTVR